MIQSLHNVKHLSSDYHQSFTSKQFKYRHKVSMLKPRLQDLRKYINMTTFKVILCSHMYIYVSGGE